MERKINKTGLAATKVSSISPAAMKVILSKIQATTKPNPGGDRSGEAFVKGPTDFAQEGSFYKFSRPGETTPLFNIEHAGGFKIDADVVKGLEQK